MGDYVCYNMREYFKVAPAKIYACPACLGNLTKIVTQPSKVLVRIIANAPTDYFGHIFTHIYTCNTCGWWCIRERSEELMSGCMIDYDYLFVSKVTKQRFVNEGSSPKITQDIGQDSPWLKALEDEFLYNNELPLPKEIGSLFRKPRKR